MKIAYIRAIRLTALLLCAGAAFSANAAWQRPDGVWISNVCRAPSGAFWVYPMYDAQPVGFACRIPTTGEFGVVSQY